jgi:glycosyltransferase involved in cell wall biosynthesis
LEHPTQVPPPQSTPTIAILINNYNYGRFLRQAIESALGQTSRADEIVVVDDGSTDDSRYIIAGFGDAITGILKPNGGQASALNAGIAASSADWLLFLDADDFFASRKLERIRAAIARHVEPRLIVHDCDFCDAAGQPIEFLQPLFERTRVLDERANARRGRILVTLPATSGLCARRDLMQQIGPIPEDLRITADDYFKQAALLLTPVLALAERLAMRRIHAANLYTRAAGRLNSSTRDSLSAEELAADRHWNEAVIRAHIWFRLMQRYPSFGRMASKHFGRTRAEVFANGSGGARAAWARIRSQYNPVRLGFSPRVLFYVVDAYVRRRAQLWRHK